MVFTRKFSEFPNAGTLSPGQLPVGLNADLSTPTGFGNRQFNFSGSSGGVLQWNEVTVNTLIVPNNGYYPVSGGVINFQMPQLFPKNATFRIVGTVGTPWVLNLYMPGPQALFYGNPLPLSWATTSVTSTGADDSIEILCITENLNFTVIGGDGNPIFT